MVRPAAPAAAAVAVASAVVAFEKEASSVTVAA